MRAAAGLLALALLSLTGACQDDSSNAKRAAQARAKETHSRPSAHPGILRGTPAPSGPSGQKVDTRTGPMLGEPPGEGSTPPGR
jgi:hypothetical protein